MCPFVSVIVPVYNDEKYIKRCISSLLNQDYDNYEVIIVDDGSTDNSPEIIDSFSDISIVKIVHQKNSGVSAARNIGLSNSYGDYIMFVDGDDWVDTNYISYFLNLIEENHCKVGMNVRNYLDFEEDSLDSVLDKIPNTVPAEKAIKYIYDDTIFVAVWNKIYDASLFKEHKLKFADEIWYGEGMLLNIDILQRVDKIAIGKKCVYHQTPNPNSAMRLFNLNSIFNGISSMWLQRSHWKIITDEIEFEWEYHLYRYHKAIIDGLVRNNRYRVEKTVVRRAIHSLRKDIAIPMKKNIGAKQKIKWIFYYIFPIFMAKRTYRRNSHK